mmetsp:Transcript_113446/g.315904  ORF Transcript_113446/g.315904 Transcript_113446/m.315904 type:complete len:125 (+) Transcript_113446:86-460(+)
MARLMIPAGALLPVRLLLLLVAGAAAWSGDEAALVQQRLALDSGVQDGQQLIGKCEDIKELGHCQRSSQLYGFACAGWGGSWCVPPRGAKCSDLTLPSICLKSKERLGLDCGGWEEDECTDLEE